MLGWSWPACDNSRAITPPAAPDPTTTKSTVSVGLNVRLIGYPDVALRQNHASRPIDESECATLPLVPPERQYSQRLAQREARLLQLSRRDAHIGSVRLTIGASFLLVAWLCFGRYGWPPGLLAAPPAAFVAALIWHSRIRSQRTRAQRSVAFYRDGLERIHGKWDGTGRSGIGRPCMDRPSMGATGERFDEPHHIYCRDLDLFGPSSLYQLLCAARTPMGEDTLAQWLLRPASLAAILDRQAGIADLRGRLDLREDLAISGKTLHIDLPAAALIEWASSPDLLAGAWVSFAALLLPCLTIGMALVWAVWGLYYPLLAILLIELGITHLTRTKVAVALATVENAYEGLKDLSELLRRIEAERFEAAPLCALVDRLSSGTSSASRTLAKLATVANFVEARRNPFLTPLLLALMYPLLTALAAERWRRAHGHAVHAWLNGLADFEALLSLARYSYEHSDYPLAEFVEGAARFEAEQIGHPLLPREKRVGNDVSIAGATRVLLVSGSNMSGKSTLLRSIGINTVLAMAGAPVCATRLRLTPLQVGASIRVNDSLQEGSSRFYAEITRLRQLFEPFELPLLFLMDELLQGTNSADRRVGAQGVVRALLERGAIGLVSTHDLALTDIVDVAQGSLVNVHFQDEIKDGTLYFDYKLQPGLVTKSNGIELMRSIGLNV